MRAMFAPVVAAFALTAACSQPPAATTPPIEGEEAATPAPAYRASGTEPFWSVRVEHGEMHLDRPGQRTLVETIDTREETSNGWRAIGMTMRVLVVTEPCEDTMNGTVYTDTVTVQFGEQSVQGCGGEQTRPPG